MVLPRPWRAGSSSTGCRDGWAAELPGGGLSPVGMPGAGGRAANGDLELLTRGARQNENLNQKACLPLSLTHARTRTHAGAGGGGGAQAAHWSGYESGYSAEAGAGRSGSCVAMANSDAIEALTMFRGHCKPIWLFLVSSAT